VILRAARVLPIDAPAIRDGLVEIAGGRIVRVLPAAADRSAARAAEDLGEVILTPGLVNPHTHLELTCYQRQLQPGDLWTWFNGLLALRGRPGHVERERQAVVDGAWQSLRAGVTCVADISRTNLAWQALRQVPIRKVCLAEIISFAVQPPRNPTELAAALDEMPADELLVAGVSPHTPYTVTLEHARATVELAAVRGCPWVMHLGETREELAFLHGDAAAMPRAVRELMRSVGIEPPGVAPGQWVTERLRPPRPGLLVHCNYLSEKDFQLLAVGGHAVVYCPRAHHYFGHRDYPLSAVRRSGVRLLLATDSLASNQSLSILEELRYVRQQHGDDAPTPDELLHTATLEAAAALGLAGQIGSLTAGKLADLAAFPWAGSDEPAAELIDTAPPAQAVWVAGRRVV